MDFLSVPALVLGITVGYSAGAALAGKGKQVVPGLQDLLIIAVVGLAALLLRDTIGHGISVVVWLLAACLTNALLISFTWRSRPGKQGPNVPAVDRRSGLMSLIWHGWKGFSTAMGNYQGRILMALFYFVVVTPFGALTRVFSDRMGLKSRSTGTYWEPRDIATPGLDDARRQF